MKNNNAIIILWQGNDLPEYLVEKIQTILLANGICEGQDLTIVVKDENSIANAILRDTVNKHCNVESNIIRFAKEPESATIEHAVIYIGGRFEASLGNTIGFTVDITQQVLEAKSRSFKTAEDDRLLNAIEIIAKNDAPISNALARKYHFNASVVKIITDIYNKTK